MFQNSIAQFEHFKVEVFNHTCCYEIFVIQGKTVDINKYEWNYIQMQKINLKDFQFDNSLDNNNKKQDIYLLRYEVKRVHFKCQKNHKSIYIIQHF